MEISFSAETHHENLITWEPVADPPLQSAGVYQVVIKQQQPLFFFVSNSISIQIFGRGFSAAPAPDRAESLDVNGAASQDCHLWWKESSKAPHTAWHTHTLREVSSTQDDKWQTSGPLACMFSPSHLVLSAPSSISSHCFISLPFFSLCLLLQVGSEDYLSRACLTPSSNSEAFQELVFICFRHFWGHVS